MSIHCGEPAHGVLLEEQPGPSTAGLIPASDDHQMMFSQLSGKRPASQENILNHHRKLVMKLRGMFSQKQWRSICAQVEMMEYVTTSDMDNVTSMEQLFMALKRNGIIKHGEYSKLREIFASCDVEAGRLIDECTVKIRGEREGPSPVKQPRTGGPDQEHSAEIHPDLKPMIETTKARIKKEKKTARFYLTKGFRDAKDMLLKNRVVVIKGNTGDGKTAIAVQLLHWLSQERQAGQPLQIHKLKKLDLFTPNSQCITFIDDIFGERDVCQKAVEEWDKKIYLVKTLFADVEATNFLVITIRNEIFNSLEKNFCETIFTDENIIDLSGNTYKVEEEKKGLLELYKPEKFSWSENEIHKILICAPNIGFPQCCQLFYSSVELQKERSRFFENPFRYLKKALSKLQGCPALLYLFLSGGMIRGHDLDPNSKKVNTKKLEEAFDINLFPGKYGSSKSTQKQKVTFVKECLEELVGFLVIKEKVWWGDEDIYSFQHDSVYVAVGRLYGKATPVGYIQNCPSKSLSYLTTSKTATDMIVISSDHYTDMCERLLREFECKEHEEISVGSLDVWNDPVFVETFVRMLNDRKVDKLDVLNKACYFGAEECALYLLSEGVKPDEDTALSVVRRHWNDGNKQVRLLKKVVVYCDDEAKLAVLNDACSYRAEECVFYLLSEGVKPDTYTDFWSLVSYHSYESNRQVGLLKKCFKYCDDETNYRNVLMKACSLGAEECALYLLSEGIKPDKWTNLWSLVSRYESDGNKLCFLKKIFAYCDDELKLDMLSNACYDCAEECVLYLLSEGVKPNKDTATSLVDGYWNDGQLYLLKQVFVYCDDETKLAMLNYACSCVCVEEIVLFLLSESVKPDKDTDLWQLVREYSDDGNRQLCLLKKLAVYLNDDTKRVVLNDACADVAEECVLYLLSEGVKPDKDIDLWPLVCAHSNDGNRQVCLLKKLVVYFNDETKLSALNRACRSGAEECALYLLCEGVEPDKDTVFKVVQNGSMTLLRKLLEYDITPKARDNLTNYNVLQKACEYKKDKMLTLLCNTYPHLVHDTTWIAQTTFHVVTQKGNLCMFQTLERLVLNSLSRVEEQQTKCESENGHVVHKNCVCAQYMLQLVDTVGKTLLHSSCYWAVNKEVCFYLCQSYPGLTTTVDEDGRHCLHYIAEWTSDVDFFTEFETYVKRHLESTGRKYDVTTILTNDGKSVLDVAKTRADFWGLVDTKNCTLLEHLVKVFGK